MDRAKAAGVTAAKEEDDDDMDDPEMLALLGEGGESAAADGADAGGESDEEDAREEARKKQEEEDNEAQGSVDKNKNWSSVNLACQESKLSYRGSFTAIAFTNWLWSRCIRPKLEETKAKLPELDISGNVYGIEDIEEIMGEFMPAMKPAKK